MSVTIETDLKEILGEVKQSIKELNTKMDRQYQELTHKMDRQYEELNRKIDKQSEELNRKIDKQSEELNRKIDKQSEDINRIDKNLATLSQKVEGIDSRLIRVETTQQAQVWALIGLLGTALLGLGKFIFFPNP